MRSAERPTAVVAADGELAIVIIQTLRHNGLKLPADVSVIGFDDIPLARPFDPPLTAVRLPIAEATSAAVDHLLQQVGNPRTGALHLLLEPELIVRESCQPPSTPE